MKTIATINFKGGVGKTTATWALGHVAALGANVNTLIFDLDAQMSLTESIAMNEDGSPFKNFHEWQIRSEHKKKAIFAALDEYTKPIPFNFGINYDFIYRISIGITSFHPWPISIGPNWRSLTGRRSSSSSSAFWERSATLRTYPSTTTCFPIALRRLAC